MDKVTTTVGRVQDCGCIALPEELQAQTGLYPGATYELEMAEGGASILLRILEPGTRVAPSPGTRCS
jgi:hypothetical protein